MVTVVGRYGEMDGTPYPRSSAFGRLDPLPPGLGRLDPLPPAVGRRYLPPSLRSGGLILALASLRGTHPRSRFAPGDSSSLSLRSGGLILALASLRGTHHGAFQVFPGHRSGVPRR